MCVRKVQESRRNWQKQVVFGGTKGSMYARKGHGTV